MKYSRSRQEFGSLQKHLLENIRQNVYQATILEGNAFDIEVLSEQPYPDRGYTVREENWAWKSGTMFSAEKPQHMVSAYSLKDGSYIGDEKTADKLFKRHGITIFETRKDGNNVACIGFNEKDQKWFGWSHRAIFGFGIGDEVKEGDCEAGYLPIGFRAETLADAKKMAICFARSID